jgi:uncharacterized protein involved in response to NO
MMTALADVASSSDSSPRPVMTSKQAFEITRAREEALSHLLIAFVVSGLFFMVFPGTFLGVWNLLQISGRQSVASVSQAWLQAHGHAQVFGWVGSFIMGIGFYSIPKLRNAQKSPFIAAWICWAIWTFGVGLRWTANVYGWGWRLLLPVSALFELGAFLIFFAAVSQHRPANSTKGRMDPWIWVVISASVGLFLALIANLAGCFYVSFHGISPTFLHVFDQRYLALMAWGFLVPFVWGFSAKWMSVFLGLKPLRPALLAAGVVTNVSGVVLTMAGIGWLGSWVFVAGVALAVAGLRMFEPAVNEAKIRGVHSSFPVFVRMAYAWLVVAAILGVAATLWDSSGGIWGASRHALTVGFVAVMIASVGQRILPAFAGMRVLWNKQLMFAALLLLTIGCALRVSCEVLAYQEYAGWAWSVLPYSALLELAGLTAFAINIVGTFVLQPSHAQTQPLVVGTTELRTGEAPH